MLSLLLPVMVVPNLFLSSVLWQPELSVLIDALEQYACKPQIAGILARTLLNILQTSAEKTIASFKSLNGILRLLKVMCIQAKESRSESLPHLVEEKSHSHEVNQTWFQCTEIFMELLSAYLAVADDGRISILHSHACIDCLFELFWEKSLRDHVMKYILELMKVILCYIVSSMMGLIC